MKVNDEEVILLVAEDTTMAITCECCSPRRKLRLVIEGGLIGFGDRRKGSDMNFFLYSKS